MIKILVDDSIVNDFYDGVKDYIRLDLFSKKDKNFFTTKKIEEIIKCKPNEFIILHEEIKNKHINFHKLKLAFIGAQANSKNKAGKANGYNKFSTKKSDEYRAYNLADVLKIDVCPYCNKNYTYTIMNKSKQYTRPDFDHFLPKEKYPYFALSFYNLIPSCQICNRTLKHTKEFTLNTHLHPYQDDFNSIKKFTTTKPLVLCNKEEDFEIEFKDKSSDKILVKKANKNIEDLALELQYNRHKDIVLELKDRYDLYNDASIQIILKDTNVFKQKGEEYIKSLIMCSDTKDKNINKRPLSKLIKDISEELDLI